MDIQLITAPLGSLQQRIQAWYQPVARDPAEDAATSQAPAVEAGLPLRLQLTGSASGNPDLRLQLLSVRAGTACERVQHHQAPQQRNAVVAGIAGSANKAGSLLFLRLVFADGMHGSEGPLIALGAVSLIGQAALATHVQRQQAIKQLQRRTSAVPRRCRRAAVEIASGAWPAAKQVVRLPGEYVEGQPFLGSTVDVVSASGGLTGTSFSIGASVPVRRGRTGPLPNPPAPPPSMAPPPRSGAEAAPSRPAILMSMMAELAPSTDSSSSSRSRSDPLSSEPSTPTHPPTFQNMHDFQSSRASTVTDSPATSSSWADSGGLPASEHRVGKRIAELQQHTQQQDHQSVSTHSERDPLGAAGTMLLSEVDLGAGRAESGGSAERLPSSEVLLTDGRTVSVTGNDAREEAAPLFGRGDHSAQEQALSVRDRCDLLMRASFLVTVFLPFLLLGPILLLLASQFAPSAPAQAQAAGLGAGAGNPGTSDQQAAPAQKNLGTSGEIEVMPPTQPSASRTQAVGVASQLRTAAFKLLLMGCRSSGAAFIKWGQWSATREDIFPADFCRVLSELHDKAPVHKWEASKAAIEKAFGLPVEHMFESIDHSAIASGSIAQVHRAVMTIEGVRRVVAVKVRHPGVADIIRRDFQVLKPVAAATSKVPALKGLSLKESVSQFSSTMTAQADLRVECAHLRRFYNNFASVSQSVTPPYPFPGCETAEVLIETFEPGESVAKYIREPSPFNTQIVSLGVDTYLKMLLADNFVHTDLHPGNIMVRIRGTDKVSAEHKSLEEIRSQLQLVLLDFGLAEELTPRVRKHFISFLHMISAGNGRRAAHHMLLFSTKQECPRPEAFADDMEALFTVEAQIDGPDGIDVDKVLKDVLKLARRHEVGIDSSYAALVLGVCVIVGFATSLDNRINIMDAATSCFLQHSLTGKATGRLY
ncbi:hypothetical protein WJX79_001935 [Trebouxia sp. C0005]